MSGYSAHDSPFPEVTTVNILLRKFALAEGSPCIKPYVDCFLFFLFKKNVCIYLFIFACVGSSLLRAGFRGERGLLFVAVRGLLIAVASLVVEHRL